MVRVGLAGVVSALVFTGCASVSVQEERWKAARPGLPGKIYVEPYAVPAGSLKLDREGTNLTEVQQGIRAAFAADLVERLGKYVAPSEVLMPGARPPAGAWVVTGEFLRVNQGSRALRSVVGFGLGGTKMEVVTRIEEVGPGGKRRELARIVTTGGSNAEPGAIFSGPFGAAPRLVIAASFSGVTTDARRTARVVTAAIAEKLGAMGYDLPGPRLQAKRLGSLPGSNE